MRRLTTYPFGSKMIWMVSLACLVIASFLASPLFPAHAAAATHTQCQILLAKIRPGERTSRVLSHRCVTGEQSLAAPAGSTQLMTWWEDANFQGDSTKIYGDSGPCDADGYGISWVGIFWNDRISSFETWNNCNYTSAFWDRDYGHPCQNYTDYEVSYVGDNMNDNISSFFIANGRHHRC
jgi:hypothetical protein